MVEATVSGELGHAAKVATNLRDCNHRGWGDKDLYKGLQGY